MTKKTALITGIYGQDAAYLAQYLLQSDYNVVGSFRRGASQNDWRLASLGVRDDIQLVEIELLEFSNILRAIEQCQPDEIYNLAAQSFVGSSFEQPIYTSDVDGLGVTRLLESIRTINPDIRFYQASTSEMFGKVQSMPQTEETPFHPRSPYGVAKLYGHWIVKSYRESYDVHAVSGILFNHESPLRGLEFVTRKITNTLAKIKDGQADILELGNMNAQRDWGHARDYVRGMHAMTQIDTPDDYILATGQTHSVEDFVNIAAEIAGYKLDWVGEDIDRIAVDTQTGRTLVQVNEKFFRPAEVDLLLGDASKARKALGWVPETSFEDLVAEMMESDLAHVSRKQ